MLVIRAEQMDTFKKATLLSFEDAMIQHMARFSPPLFKAAGKEQVRKAVWHGIEQAKKYGFTNRGPVRFYLELMVLFGSSFDTDPQYPWANEILAGQDTGSQMQRAERLYEKTIDYRQKVVGIKDAYALDAFRNIANFTRQSPIPSSDQFVVALLREIARIYPQKAAYVGEKGLEALIRKGMNGAQRQQFRTIRGANLVVMLMFTLGHGCGVDPLYPWILTTLKDESITDPEIKVQNLWQRFLNWLEYRMDPARGAA